MVDVLPDDLAADQIIHLHPNVLPQDFAKAVNDTIKSRRTHPTFQVDIDLSSFEESDAEAEPVSPGGSVPAFIDFGAGVAPAPSPVSPLGSKEPHKPGKSVPAGFDFEIPVPPLAAKPAPQEATAVPAVEIDPGELELIVEEDGEASGEDLLWDSLDGEPLEGEPGEEAGVEFFESLETSSEEVDAQQPKQRLFFGGQPLDEDPSAAEHQSSEQLGEDVLLASSDEISDLSDLDVAPLPDPAVSAEGTPHFDLDLSVAEVQGAPGAVWLMKIASEKENGRLYIPDGPAKGVLYFANGEGVWAEFENAVDGLRDFLMKRDLPTPGGQSNASLSEGEYLFRMIENDALQEQDASEAILDLVRERILQLAFEGWGDFRFERDDVMAEVPPVLSVHPFGLILESRQRELAPTDLIGLSSELENDVLKPGPASTWVGNTLDRYLNNLDLTTFLEERPTVGDFFTKSSLGPITGTLMVLALRDTQVITTKHAG